ncbi:MAG: HesA/MoeB/ThiF family protein [Desulfobacterales bacterium]|nr:HesA/MoeB/ThiF family protein [Desulfobacterales bacterium]
MLTAHEKERYDRQISMEELGEQGQEKLKNARVFIAGAGGLGSPAAMYLAVAGVAAIRIVDNDAVELSNLNRQILHGNGDIGKEKVDSAREKLEGLNPDVVIEAVCEKITGENVSELLNDSHLIIDALDNWETRMILNGAALERGVPLVHGAVSGFEGRAMTIVPGRTACLGCLHKGPAPVKKTPVVGVTPAVIAGVQATEAIKYFTGAGELLENRMIFYDGLTMKFTEFKVNKNPGCHCCGRGAPAPRL